MSSSPSPLTTSTFHHPINSWGIKSSPTSHFIWVSCFIQQCHIADYKCWLQAKLNTPTLSNSLKYSHRSQTSKPSSAVLQLISDKHPPQKGSDPMWLLQHIQGPAQFQIHLPSIHIRKILLNSENKDKTPLITHPAVLERHYCPIRGTPLPKHTVHCFIFNPQAKWHLNWVL